MSGQPQETRREERLRIIYQAIRSAAINGERCPSSHTLAKLAKFKCPTGVLKVLAEFEMDGIITRRRDGNWRIIQFTADGISTARKPHAIIVPAIPKTPIAHIVHAAAAVFGTTVKDIMGRSRFPEHTRPRHAVVHVAIAQGYGPAMIGRRMGRDHKTVAYSNRQAAVLAEYYPAFRMKLDDLIDRVAAA